MADLLGSLLPTGYMAPDVQSVLGGTLFISCDPSGYSVMESCETGPTPTADCVSGSYPEAECLGHGSVVTAFS